jgi:hypothetical protein
MWPHREDRAGGNATRADVLGTGPGRTRGERGHIEREGGCGVTRGDMLAEGEAVGDRMHIG